MSRTRAPLVSDCADKSPLASVCLSFQHCLVLFPWAWEQTVSSQRSMGLGCVCVCFCGLLCFGKWYLKAVATQLLWHLSWSSERLECWVGILMITTQSWGIVPEWIICLTCETWGNFIRINLLLFFRVESSAFLGVHLINGMSWRGRVNACLFRWCLSPSNKTLYIYIYRHKIWYGGLNKEWCVVLVQAAHTTRCWLTWQHSGIINKSIKSNGDILNKTSAEQKLFITVILNRFLSHKPASKAFSIALNYMHDKMKGLFML